MALYGYAYHGKVIMVWDWFWYITLGLANEMLMLPIGLIYGLLEGVYAKKWKPVFGLLVLLIASIFVGEYLKSIFKIPLMFDPTRYAFPSGHTQFSTVFYGWICYRLVQNTTHHFLKIFYIAVTLCILILATASIVHAGYHLWRDILGGFVSGGILLYLWTRVKWFFV